VQTTTEYIAVIQTSRHNYQKR